MKSMMLIIDGLGDEACPELHGRTPLRAARCANMTALAAAGEFGLLSTCPEGFLPESVICIMGLLGVDQAMYPEGRASLEALACDIALEEDDVAFRCNLAAIDGAGRLVSFNGAGLEAEAMAAAVKAVWTPDRAMSFVHLGGYRNLLIVKGGLAKTKGLTTFPPHEHIGERFSDLWPRSMNKESLAEDLRRFMAMNSEQVSKRILERAAGKISGRVLEKVSEKMSEKKISEEISERITEPVGKIVDKGVCTISARESGQELRYLLWPWGPSVRPVWPAFTQLHGISGAMVAGIETVTGIGKALRMPVAPVGGGTGDVDTDLSGKLEAGLKLIETFDFVCIHVNGADEAAHRRNGREKADFLTRVDRELLAPLLNRVKPDCRLMVCGDHATRSTDGKHARDPVPYIIAPIPLNRRRNDGPATDFFEEGMAAGGLRITAAEGLNRLLKGEGR